MYSHFYIFYTFAACNQNEQHTMDKTNILKGGEFLIKETNASDIFIPDIEIIYNIKSNCIITESI